ncbi:MAG TPA: 30S ribosomal protein S17 [Candidatus Nanoarchaeia archaeon]|nr:30S ribosomal protein S17 [Candidatus Nanoarchaeia archaeon]
MVVKKKTQKVNEKEAQPSMLSKVVEETGLSLRGREFIVTVIKAKAQKTAVVTWDRLFYLPKFQRFEKRRSKIQVHNPICINAQAGDKVKIVETRPISKTKHFVIIERLQ